MVNVERAIKRHLKFPSSAATDIFNRCYEAVFLAIVDTEKNAKKDWENFKNPIPKTERKTVDTDSVIHVLNEVRRVKK